MSTYNPDNLFAKIIRGEVPCHKVYEDEDVLAFMDVMPQTRGHTLVVPKAEARNLLDADPESLAATVQQLQSIARAVQRAFKADGMRINQFSEAAAGQTVFHLHFHIIPIYENVSVKAHRGGIFRFGDDYHRWPYRGWALEQRPKFTTLESVDVQNQQPRQIGHSIERVCMAIHDVANLHIQMIM